MLSQRWATGDRGRTGFRLALGAAMPLVLLTIYVATSTGTPSVSAFAAQGLLILVSTLLQVFAFLICVTALVKRRGSWSFAIAGAMLSGACVGALLSFFLAVAS